MKLPNGLFWPVPVMNIVASEQLTDAVKNADSIALRDPNVEGNPPLAIMKVSAIETLSTAQKQLLIEKTFGTTDPEHPRRTGFRRCRRQRAFRFDQSAELFLLP